MPTEPAARHRAVAGRFTEVVVGVTDWEAPAPVEGWTARDVVGHLVGWLPGLLSSGSAVRLPAGPPVSEDPVAAWDHHARVVQAVLDDPASAAARFSHPHAGDHDVATAVDRFYTTDVFMHTWDLARATGQDDTLDEATCAQLLAGLEPVEEMLRSSGQYGPRVDVPADASVQDRFVGFIGRDPAWRP